MSAPAPHPVMTEEAFRLLSELVHEACGIAIQPDLKYVMERRLLPRVQALGLSDYDAYYRFLLYDAGRRAELDAAIEALTTNETYFFREPAQLSAFSEELLPLLEARNERLKRLRIWSAGCSTGEEAYTLAMLVLQSGRFADWDVVVHGTDISQRVLQVARRGEYTASALRATRPEQVARWFDQDGPKVRVKDSVRALVSFGQLNLMDTAKGQLVPRSDVIFCRNVLIYFDVSARRRVARVLYEKLFPGGYLLLGHAESLMSLSTDFQLVHLETELVYQRPQKTTDA